LKTLYIVRHAKSSWKDINLGDMERPLKKRGKEDIRHAASLLRDEGVKPNLVLASPAIRTYETAKVLVNKLDVDRSNFRVEDKLYMPDFPSILKVVLYLDNGADTVMIVGHEPSLSALINYFLQHPIEGVVTSSVTMLRFHTADWKEIGTVNLEEAYHRNRHDWKGYSLY